MERLAAIVQGMKRASSVSANPSFLHVEFRSALFRLSKNGQLNFGVWPMKIAIVGTRISGMVTAIILSESHDLTVFEKNDYIGGYTHTIDVEVGGRTYPVDTGFIVFNEKTYPNFVELLRRLDVPWKNPQMSFSLRCDQTGLEFCPSSLDSLFAQRRREEIKGARRTYFCGAYWS